MIHSCLFLVFILVVYIQSPVANAQAIVANHLCTDISQIPLQWIESAKSTLHIMYGHTSHGSQIITGMQALVTFHGSIYDFNNGGTGGALDLREGAYYGDGDMSLDCGYYPNWVDNTRSYLGTADVNGRGSNHPEINVIIWSWCGQVSGETEQSMLDEYLTPMS